MHPYVPSSVIYSSQDLETAQVPISRWVDKKAEVHLHNEVLVGCKNEGNPIFCDNMESSMQS